MSKADEWKNKGNAALQADKYKEAIDCYTQAIKLAPKNHVYYSNRSAAYCKTEEYEKALEDAEKCVEVNSKWGKGYVRKAAALEFLGRNADAMEAYEAGLKVDPSNESLKKGKADALANVSKSERHMPEIFPGGSKIWERLEADPKTQSFAKDPDFRAKVDAIQKCPNDIMKHLSDPKIMKALEVMMSAGMPAGGGGGGSSAGASGEAAPPPTKKAWEEATPPPKPKTPEPEMSDDQKASIKLKDAGNAAYKAKKFEEALENYEKAFEKDKTNMSILSNIAAVYLEQGKYNECIAKCEEAVDVGRENRADFKLIAKALSRIAKAHLKLNNSQEALKFYHKSLSEFRDPAIVKEVQKLEKQVKEDAAKAYLDPEKAEEERQKGNEAFKNGDYPTAVKAYTEAIKRNPEDARIYSNRAASYSKLMEFNLALKDCDKCIELDPTFLKGHIRKGHVCIALKNPQKAMDAFEKAIDLDANNDEARQGMRQAMQAINSDPEMAKKRAMEDPEVQEIMRDPAMRMILEQMQNEPGSLREHLTNPNVRGKLQKLMEAGIIQMR